MCEHKYNEIQARNNDLVKAVVTTKIQKAMTKTNGKWGNLLSRVTEIDGKLKKPEKLAQGQINDGTIRCCFN